MHNRKKEEVLQNGDEDWRIHYKSVATQLMWINNKTEIILLYEYITKLASFCGGIFWIAHNIFIFTLKIVENTGIRHMCAGW